MGAALGSLTEIRELKTEITGLRTDLKRFIERANQQHVEGVLGDLKKNYAGLFTDHQVETAKGDLSAHMVSNCKMRDKCYEVFMDFLQNTSKHINCMMNLNNANYSNYFCNDIFSIFDN